LEASDDPYAKSRSANVFRRHLTNTQKREAIKNFKAVYPNVSNVKLAKLAGVSDKTVAAVLEPNVHGSEIPSLEHSGRSAGQNQGQSASAAAVTARKAPLIVAALKAGGRVTAIAREVGVSAGTVSDHKQRLMAKGQLSMG